MNGMFDILEIAARDYQKPGMTEVQLMFPESVTQPYARKFADDYLCEIKWQEHKAKVRGWTAVALIPTVVGALVGFGLYIAASNRLYAFEKRKEEFEAFIRKGILPLEIAREMDITPSAVSSYQDFEVRYQYDGSIKTRNFPAISLRDKALLVGPKDIQEKLAFQRKMVFTRGIISDRAQKTGSESDKIFILDGGEDGKVYCSFEAPEIAKFGGLGLFKRHDGKKKQLSVDSLDEVIDSARASRQEIFVGGIAREGRLEADMFLFPGGRQFAYLLK